MEKHEPLTRGLPQGTLTDSIKPDVQIDPLLVNNKDVVIYAAIDWIKFQQ